MEGLMNWFRAGFGGFGLSQLSFITKVVSGAEHKRRAHLMTNNA